MTLPHWIDDARGPYGEILPPLLVPDEANTLARLLADAAALGGHPRPPARGHALAGMQQVGRAYAHNLRLREIASGDCATDVERALFEALEHGEPLSLRPPGLEDLAFDSFAPVLQKTGLTTWRLGLPGHGRVQTFTGRNPDAVARAQQMYAQWSEVDDEAFLTTAKRLVGATLDSLLHDFFFWQLTDTGRWQRGGKFGLTLLGKHNVIQLDTPAGARLLQTERLRAVRICDALARQAGVEPLQPAASAVRNWLSSVNVSGPQRAEWSPGGLPARLFHQGREFALVQRQDRLVLYPIVNSAYGKKLAEAFLEPPVQAWLAGDAEGRQAIAMWILWKAGVR